MKKYSLILIVFVTITLLNGCASMGLEDCKTANWGNYAQSDLNDYHENRYDHWVDACKSFGITPNKVEYENAFNAGLNVLCTYQNGYLIGNAGQELPKICPIEAQENFVRGFIEGKKIHNEELRIIEQKKLMEENNQRELAFRERMIGTYQNRKCQSELDCKIEDKCQSNKCENTGKSCNTNIDCTIVGNCESHFCRF